MDTIKNSTHPFHPIKAGHSRYNTTMNVSAIPTTACAPAAIATPTLFGAEILSLSASPVTNFSYDVPAEYNYNHGDVSVINSSFCNITVTYTHPGQHDLINVETWLPLGNWNERLQATGGGR